MRKKNPKVYAFIDSQNLNLGTSKNLYKGKKLIYKGWKLDFQRFRVYLKEKHKVDCALLFIGYIRKNKKLYEKLEKYGYDIVFKPTVVKKGRKSKGNVDAELVLHSCRLNYDDYAKAIIVSGDGDFYCLYKFLDKEKKLRGIIIPNKKSESSLLKKFQKYKIYIWRHRDTLEKKNGGRSSSPRR